MLHFLVIIGWFILICKIFVGICKAVTGLYELVPKSFFNIPSKIKEFESRFDKTVDIWFEKYKYRLLAITAFCDISVIVVIFAIS